MTTLETATEQVAQAIVVPAEQDDDGPKGKKIDLPTYVPAFVIPENVDLQLVDYNKEGIGKMKVGAQTLSVTSKKEKATADRYRKDNVNTARRAIKQRVAEVTAIHKTQIEKVKAYGDELLGLVAEVEDIVYDKINQYDAEIIAREEALRKRADDRVIALKNIGFVWAGRNESYVLLLPAAGDLPSYSESVLMEDVKQLDNEAFDRIWNPAHEAYQQRQAFNEQAEKRRLAEQKELEDLRAFKAAQTKTQEPPAPVELPTPVLPPVPPAITDPVIPQPYQRVATVPARQVDPEVAKHATLPATAGSRLATEIQRILNELDPIYDLSADSDKLVVEDPALAKLVHQLRVDLSELLLAFRNQVHAL